MRVLGKCTQRRSRLRYQIRAENVMYTFLCTVYTHLTQGYASAACSPAVVGRDKGKRISFVPREPVIPFLFCFLVCASLAPHIDQDNVPMSYIFAIGRQHINSVMHNMLFMRL